MLTFLRKQAQSPLLQAMVLIIAIVFIFWGVGSNIGSSRNSVATINKTEISPQQFNNAYERTVDQYRQQFGGTIPKGLLENIGLKQQVLSQLIKAELLRQGGREMGIMVSDLALQQAIREMAVFHKDGVFNLELYNDLLRQNKMSPTSFENSMREDLLSRAISEAISTLAVVPEKEAHMLLELNNEEIKFQYVALAAQAFRDLVKIDDKELASFFTQHQEEYQSEPKIRLKYLYFSLSAAPPGAAPDEAQIAARYERDKARYSRAEERRARHILLRVAESDNEQVKAEKKKKALDVVKLAKEGHDFAELAKQYSEDPAKDQGGDLGFFGRGRMVKPFEEAVFALQQGKISELVETQFGYHIIKLEEIKPAHTQPLDEVKAELVAAMQHETAKERALERASTAYEAIMNAGSVAKYKESGAEPVEQTDFFAKSAPPATLVKDPKFLDTAFALNKGELSSLIELSTGYAIVFVDDVQKPQTPELSTIRERVASDYKKEKAVELAQKAAAELLQQAGAKGGLAAATAQKYELKESGYLQRSAPMASAGQIPYQLIQAVLKDAGKNPRPLAPLAIEDTFYLYEVLDKRQGAKKIEEATNSQLTEQLRGTTKLRLVTTWLAQVESQTKVWINPQYRDAPAP